MNKNELLKIKNKCSEIINLIDELDENGLIFFIDRKRKINARYSQICC